MGIDLTQSMLDKLAEKYPDKHVKLICASYIDCDFGSNESGEYIILTL